MTQLAYLFPGQGSQTVGMLSNLAAHYPSILNDFNSVSEKTGFDVWNMIQNGPEAVINQTEYTQVIMLTADVAVFNLLVQKGANPNRFMAGHSLGEFAALVCAKAIPLPDAAVLVQNRGRLMQDTVPAGTGAMAALIGLSDSQVAELCALVSSEESQVSPANFNALGQVVIAGHVNAVNAACDKAMEQGAILAKILPVSVPCHCPLLKNAADLFEAHLEEASFKTPEAPVISNVDLSIYESPAHIRRLLKEQLYKPVRWVETIQLLKSKGVDSLLECGPGKVLAGLTKRIDKSMTALCVQDKSTLESLLSNQEWVK